MPLLAYDCRPALSPWVPRLRLSTNKSLSRTCARMHKRNSFSHSISRKCPTYPVRSVATECFLTASGLSNYPPGCCWAACWCCRLLGALLLHACTAVSGNEFHGQYTLTVGARSPALKLGRRIKSLLTVCAPHQTGLKRGLAKLFRRHTRLGVLL